MLDRKWLISMIESGANCVSQRSLSGDDGVAPEASSIKPAPRVMMAARLGAMAKTADFRSWDQRIRIQSCQLQQLYNANFASNSWQSVDGQKNGRLKQTF